MHLPWRHRPGYHEWSNTTPVIDAIRAVIGVASLVIGSHAGLFLLFALHRGDRETAAENALFFVAIAVANGAIDTLRHWRRHHG